MSKSKNTFQLIYILGFFFALATGLPSYIMSSFLADYVGLNKVSLFLTMTTAINLVAIIFYPKFIKRFTNFRTMLLVVITTLVSLLLLGITQFIWSALILFIIQYIGLALLFINLDVALENISDDRHTGRIRTKYLTVVNTAWVLSPLIMGQVVGVDNYPVIFMLAGFMLIIGLFVLYLQKNQISDHRYYYDRDLTKLYKIIFKNKDLLKIFYLRFVLSFFYCLMVLYVPIYLHQYLGFDWSVIGIIFTIMLLPFVIFQIPAGSVADKFWGEKEIMSFGFFIMFLTVLLVFAVGPVNAVMWALILFFSRVGAALVEAMIDSYFFKKIDSQDMDMIIIFRDLYPLGWLIGAAASFIILLLFPIQYIFFFLAFLILISLWPTLTIRDTK